MDKYVWSTDEELFVLQLLHGNTDEQLLFYKCKKDYYEVVAQKMNDEFGYKVMTDSKVKDKFRDFAKRYVEHQKQKFSHLPEVCAPLLLVHCIIILHVTSVLHQRYSNLAFIDHLIDQIESERNNFQ
jgi:hypothetical protein